MLRAPLRAIPAGRREQAGRGPSGSGCATHVDQCGCEVGRNKQPGFVQALGTVEAAGADQELEPGR